LEAAKVLLLSLSAVGILFSLACFEWLLQHEHAVAAQQWEADGRPQGMLTVGMSIRAPFVSGRVYRKWVWSTPAWILTDAQAMKAHLGLRTGWLVALASALCLLLVLVLGR
jgi:hypothetical protein